MFHADHSMLQILGHVCIATFFLVIGVRNLAISGNHVNKFRKMGIPFPKAFLAAGYAFQFAGGWMVLALLAGLTLSVVSGLAVYAAEDGLGPLAGVIAISDFWGDLWEELHEFFAELTLLLVLVHIAGVLVSSVLHGENLIRAMITGYKQPPPADD